MSEAPTPSGRPIPIPDEASQPFFDAAARGLLLIKHCQACERYLPPAAEFCDACFGPAPAWYEASGRATLYSFVINHQVLHPGFANEVPYDVLIVELEEGPRINGNFIGNRESLRVNMPLQVAFEPAGEVFVPKWCAAHEQPASPDEAG